MTRRLTSIAIVTALSCFWVLGDQHNSSCCKNEKSSHECKEKSACRKAPDFTLENYDGRKVSLADFNDTVVVLEWLNYDCPFVKYHYEEQSTMTDLAKKYEQKGVVWLAINTTHYAGHEDNRAFAEKHGLPYPILNDSDGQTGHAYKAKRTPEMFVINKEGNIAYHGAIDNAQLGKLNPDEDQKVNYVDKALSELLADEEITTPKTKPYGCSVKYEK